MNVHPQFEEDFELYALGDLDPDDKAEFEAHLLGCPECGAKLNAARGLVAKLALAAPVSKPSPELRERVLEPFRKNTSVKFKLPRESATSMEAGDYPGAGL